MWIVCITSVRHVLTVNGYGGRQTKENEKSWCFKGWETLDSYPLGVYNEKAGSITFPANSLYVSMADYQDGGAYPCTNPSYLYLSAEAYLNSLETE